MIWLNSDLCHYLYEHLYGGTRKGGGYLHFLKTYVQPLPLPPLPDSAEVMRIHDVLVEGRGGQEQAEALVREACAITDVEKSALDSYCYPPW